MAEESGRIQWPRGISRWPDGVSLSSPAWGRIPGIGYTHYFNAGSPSAPGVTLALRRGMGGGGFHLVFLRDGMTSQDTLGYGATADIGLGPTATVNASIPAKDLIPQLQKMKVTSIEAGAGLPGFAVTQTYTPQQIADFLNRFIFHPATRSQDELSPFERSLQSGLATVGQPTQPPVKFLGTRSQGPLGDGMTGWGATVGAGPSSTADANRPNASPSAGPVGRPLASILATHPPPVPYLPPTAQDKPGGILGMLIDAGHVDPVDPGQLPAGGLLGLIQDYLRNNPGADR
jgi:hypothetical protein